MKAKALIIVETPFQLLCAYEYMLTHVADYRVCIRLSGVPANDAQIMAMTTDMSIKVDKTIMAVPGRKISCLLASAVFWITFAGHYDYVLLGSYLSGLMKVFATLTSKDKTILLDDGMGTLLADRLIHSSCPERYAAFTIFKLDASTYLSYERHFFEGLRRKFPRYLEAEGSSITLFIGQKLIDIGFIDTESYLSTIRWAAAKCDGEKLYYIPHRGESIEHADKIARIPGVEIMRPDGALEYFVLRNGYKPVRLFAITSTALVTLSSLFPTASCYAIFPRGLSKAKFPHWDLVSNYMSAHGGIDVIDGVV